MKSYTDLSQSKKLAEILPLKTSDMIYTMVNGYHTPFVRIEKAMAEDGYTFDFECKKLKKIEHKYTCSEEDKDMIQALNVCLDAAIKRGMDYISFDSKSILIGKVKTWLKSLRPQTTWKPSDEQMAALQYVYRNLNPPLSDKLGWDSIKTLELMYQELKKLKE